MMVKFRDIKDDDDVYYVIFMLSACRACEKIFDR